MTMQAALLVSAIAFVGTHFLLSHPLRGPLARAIGEGRFIGVYSLVALATFAAMIWSYNRIGREPLLWTIGDGGWIAATLLMWFASILLVGSFIKNPAFPGAPGPIGGPAGVFRITRHPMMWSFATWAIVHAAVVGTPKALILDGAILVLALVGAAAQDSKKREKMGEAWHEWTAQTAFVPFTRGIAWPGTAAVAGGTILFFLATWLHPIPAGFWRWIS